MLVLGVDHVASRFVLDESFGKTLCGLNVFGHSDLAGLMVDVRFDNGAGAGGAGGAEGGCGFRIGTGSGFGSGGDIIPRHDCDSMLVVGWVGDTTSSTTTKIAFLMLAYRPKRTLASTYDLLIRFSDSRVDRKSVV